MSFYTGTQCELLYAMPGSGAAVTGTTATTQLLSQNSTTSPGLPYAIPAGFFNFGSGTTLGKSLLIKGGGWFTTSSTQMTCTLTLALDTAAGTYGTLLAATGAFTPSVSVSNGAWDFEVLVTATLLGTGAHTQLNTVGHVNWGPANNAGVATFSTAGVSNQGGVIMISAPQTGTVITASSAYFVDAFASWSTTTGSPTITMTNLMIFGLN